ncbi:MAG: divergent polysaccharide deacetylase family protein [Desulfovibrionaceae bacterium]|nr:divergent polysaccharide deacetylase family protein [Desulfovibrionaceae bacterium]
MGFSLFSAPLAWVRLVRFRLGADGGPLLLRDRAALRVLSALAALLVTGGLLPLLSAGPPHPAAPETPGADAPFLSGQEGAEASWQESADAPGHFRAVAESSPAPVSGGLSAHALVDGSGDVPDAPPLFPGAPEASSALPAAGGSMAPDAALYGEGSFAPLADVARQVDTALLQTAARLKLEPSHVGVLDSETRLTRAGQVYPFLRLALRLDGGAGGSRVTEKAFAAALRESLRVWAPRARLRFEGSGLYFVTVDEELTHSLYCGAEPRILPALPLAAALPADASRPRLTIVMDDLGESEAVARKLLALPYPVTLSVWPQAARAAYVATLAREHGRQVFLHQPMQPLGHAPGDDASELLRVGMEAALVEKVLGESLRLVPYAEGINNHMGSRFTSDPASVRVLCEVLRRLRPDILVLDSLTHSGSVLYDEARRHGFAARRRTLFLDDEHGPDDKAAVLQGLDRGLRMARRHGSAIVIGHPRPATLAALAAWTGWRAGDVDIAPLTLWPANSNGGSSAPSKETP